MAVIPYSQVELMRSRRKISNALRSNNWREVKKADLVLADRLKSASDDPQRNTMALLTEVGEIVHLYKDLVDICKLEARKLVRELNR